MTEKNQITILKALLAIETVTKNIKYNVLLNPTEAKNMILSDVTVLKNKLIVIDDIISPKKS